MCYVCNRMPRRHVRVLGNYASKVVCTCALVPCIPSDSLLQSVLGSCIANFHVVVKCIIEYVLCWMSCVIRFWHPGTSKGRDRRVGRSAEDRCCGGSNLQRDKVCIHLMRQAICQLYSIEKHILFIDLCIAAMVWPVFTICFHDCFQNCW